MHNSDDLARALAELNRELEEAEDDLVALGASEPVSVAFSDESRLCFQKMGESWHLVRVTPNGGTGYEASKIGSCGKRWRIEAAYLVPKLFEALIDARAARLTEVRAAITSLREFRAKART